MTDRKEPRYYTVAEAAPELDVAQSTVWRWISERCLSACRIGPKAIRIRQDDLMTLVTPARGSQREIEPVTRDDRPPSPPIRDVVGPPPSAEEIAIRQQLLAEITAIRSRTQPGERDAAQMIRATP